MGTISNVVVIGGIMLAAGFGYVWKESRLEKEAQAAGLSASETVAYKACSSQVSGKKVTVKGEGSFSDLQSVCLCHAKAMASTLKEENFSTNKLVIDFFQKKEFPPNVAEAAFRNANTSPVVQMMGLIRSFDGCIDRMVDKVKVETAENRRRAEELRRQRELQKHASQGT